MNVKRVAGVVAVTCILACLAACDPIVDNQADVALSSSESGPIFVSCQSREVSSIISEYRDFSVRDSKWVSILYASGSGRIESGVPFGPSQVPSGLSSTGVSSNSKVAGGSTVSLVLISDPTAANLSTTFAIPSEGLLSGEWLRPDGEIRMQPCEAN